MKVTTIDGGFRGRPHLRSIRGGLAGGLGTLSSAIQNAEAEAFLGHMSRFQAMAPIVRQALATGALPPDASRELEALFSTVQAQANEHVARLSTLEGEAQLMEWRSTAASIVGHASQAVDRARILIGDESAVRPWKIAVGIGVGALFFGGLAWLFGRS